MSIKKQYKVLHWFDAGIFPVRIMLSIGFRYDEINKMLKQKKATDWQLGIEDDKTLIDSGKNFALHRTLHKKDGNTDLFYIIFTDCINFTEYDYLKVAHEALHICQFMLPLMFDRQREYECEAYLHTFIMKEVLKAAKGVLK